MQVADDTPQNYISSECAKPKFTKKKPDIYMESVDVLVVGNENESCM